MHRHAGQVLGRGILQAVALGIVVGHTGDGGGGVGHQARVVVLGVLGLAGEPAGAGRAPQVHGHAARGQIGALGGHRQHDHAGHRVGRIENLGHLVQVGVHIGAALVHEGDAVALGQIVHLHAVTVEHHGLVIAVDGRGGQVLEGPLAVAGRGGVGRRRVVEGGVGHPLGAVEPVALERHGDAAEALGIAAVAHAVEPVVLPDHAGDASLGDLHQAEVVVHGVLPVDVGPQVGLHRSGQLGHAGLVGLHESLALRHLVDGLVRCLGGAGVGRLVVVLVQVQLLTRRRIDLALTEDLVMVGRIDGRQLLHRGGGQDGIQNALLVGGQRRLGRSVVHQRRERDQRRARHPGRGCGSDRLLLCGNRRRSCDRWCRRRGSPGLLCRGSGCRSRNRLCRCGGSGCRHQFGQRIAPLDQG